MQRLPWLKVTLRYIASATYATSQVEAVSVAISELKGQGLRFQVSDFLQERIMVAGELSVGFATWRVTGSISPVEFVVANKRFYDLGTSAWVYAWGISEPR